MTRSCSSIEEGDEIDIIHEFVEVGSHLKLKPATIRSNLDRMLQFLHLSKVNIVHTRLPVLLILQQDVEEVAILFEGIILFMAIHGLWQAQEVARQVWHPSFILLLRRQM